MHGTDISLGNAGEVVVSLQAIRTPDTISVRGIEDVGAPLEVQILGSDVHAEKHGEHGMRRLGFQESGEELERYGPLGKQLCERPSRVSAGDDVASLDLGSVCEGDSGDATRGHADAQDLRSRPDLASPFMDG